MLSSYTTFSKTEREGFEPSTDIKTRFLLAGGRFEPLSHLSTVGWEGIEPTTNKGRFYRALPTPLGEPTRNHSPDEN